MKKIKIAAAAVFIMTVLFVLPVTVKAASVGETVSQSTAEELKAIDYATNETIGKLLAPSYSLSDMLNKKNEIAMREGKSPVDITDEQAEKELNQDNVKVMSFEEAFAEVQVNIGEIIWRMVDNIEGAGNKGADFYTDKILQNKEKLLLGIAYLERLYDFDMGKYNIKEALLYESKPNQFINGQMIDNTLDWLIFIGGVGGNTLKIPNNTNVFGYGKPLGPVTSSKTLGDFLEENRQKWIPDISMDDWFVQESHAYILEKPSDWDSKGKETGLYRRLYDNAATRAYILPLLTVSEDSVYVIANSATITYGIVDCYIDRTAKETNPTHYAELREKFRQQLEQGANQQRAFIDFWYRIAKPEKREELLFNGDVVDSLRIASDASGADPAKEWSDKFGKEASRGVREFLTPLNLYANYMFADGMADGTRLRHYVSKALTERGLSTYAHELTHMLVSEVMLNGYGSRDGMLQEVYTRGMFEPYELNDPPVFNLNLIYDRLSVSDRYHNGRPDRFQDEKDLKDYMSGILDVVYTLDYAEADIILTKSAVEKQKWFHKLEQIEDSKNRYNQGEAGSKHNLDSVRELSLDEAERLNSIDDLIRENIIVSRYEVNGTQTTGTLASDGYYVVPLFSANYAGVQNNSGVSGDVMIRRQAFELLAEYGYYNGMVPYISNQYKESAKAEGTILSDQYILKRIFGDDYGTMADFKKAMFQRRIEKTNRLKPVTITWKGRPVTVNTFEELRVLMKEAVESDLVKVISLGGANNIRAQATEVELLKQEIFKAYLIQTEDFSKSIYGDSVPTDPSEPDVTEPGQPGDKDPEQPDSTGSGQLDTGTVKPDTEITKPDTGVTKPNTGTVKPGTGTTKKESSPKLLLCKVSSSKTSNTIRWNPVKSADGYEIYGAKSNRKYQHLRTVSKKSDQWKHKKLKKGEQYKYYVRAYKKVGKKRVVLAKSLSVYSTTKGGKYGNPSKIKVKNTRVSVKSGKKYRLNVSVAGKKIKKSEKKVRYVSSNTSIAKVSSKGVITGKKRGSCTVYCITRNGMSKKVKVKVK